MIRRQLLTTSALPWTCPALSQRSQPAHAGKELGVLREEAEVTIDEVAAVLFSQWVGLVKATPTAP